MENLEIATFKSRDEANQIVESLNSRTYYLAHGEYQRPDYVVRKVRGASEYYIFARYYYYSGTFGAKENGGLSWNSNELYSVGQD